MSKLDGLREVLYDGLTEIAEQYDRSSAIQEAMLETSYACRDFVIGTMARLAFEASEAPVPIPSAEACEAVADVLSRSILDLSCLPNVEASRMVPWWTEVRDYLRSLHGGGKEKGT